MTLTQITKDSVVTLSGTSQMNNLYENLLSFLEKISDESFWHAIFGERALNLLKRYFGSDVVFLGFIVYLAPIIGYHLSSLFYYVLHTIRENMYVSIQISKDQSCYEAIQQFVVKNTAQLKHLRDVEGRCIYDDEDDDDIQGPSPPPRLGLFPLDETVQKIYYKKHTLWVSKLKNGGVQKNNDNYYSNNIKDLLGMMNTNPCIQITMRGQNMELLKSFVQEWINKHYENEHGKLTIYKCMPTRYDGFEWNSIGSKELRPFSSVILKDRQKERILKDIQTFRRREHWYSIRGIPYRRGYLLYGPPGTGKTSLVQSVASKINMNVAIISLSGKMDDENFNVMLQEVPRNSILVMEDIDHCVIQDPNSGEEHAAAQAKITMSGLLNALDGVVAQEGSMVFMTCNDLTRIQPALLRPGRIDMKMELGYADKTQIRKMFWRFMGEDDMEEGEEEEGKDTKKIMASPELKDLADQFTDMIPDLEVTPAELQNFFIMHLMDKEAEKEDDEDKEEQDTKVDYSYLLDAVPAFLETVRYDRQQALEHKMNRTSLTVKNLQAQLQDQKSLAEEDTKTVVEETAVSEPVK